MIYSFLLKRGKAESEYKVINWSAVSCSIKKGKSEALIHLCSL